MTLEIMSASKAADLAEALRNAHWYMRRRVDAAISAEGLSLARADLHDCWSALYSIARCHPCLPDLDGRTHGAVLSAPAIADHHWLGSLDNRW